MLHNSMARIEEEIQQKSFDNNYLKAHVNILFTASWLNNQISDVLKEHQITTQQFNILRILKGTGQTPLTVKDLTSKMIDRMSNASRLVDKLVKKGYVLRTPSSTDRRRVDVILTQSGLVCVNSASIAVEGKIEKIFDSMSEEEAGKLSALLDQIR